MSYSLKINTKSEPGRMMSFPIVKSHFNLLAMTMIVVVAMLIGCSKNKSEEPPVGTGETLRSSSWPQPRDSMGYPVDTTALNPIIRQIANLSPTLLRNVRR